jgi:hypothetical protein
MMRMVLGWVTKGRGRECNDGDYVYMGWNFDVPFTCGIGLVTMYFAEAFGYFISL